MKRILNLGCGHSKEGTDRIDIVKTPTTTLVCDVNEGLPYDNETFDHIIAVGIFEHVRQMDTFIKEVYRVLKEGGTLFLRTDNASYLPFHVLKSHEHNKFIEHQYESHWYNHHPDDHHFHMFVPSNLLFLFSKFKDHRISFQYGGRNWFNHILLKSLPFHMGAIGIELRCRK